MAKTETIEVKINGTDIVFYPNSHQYKIDKKSIPSVTSILGMIDKSRVLLIWAENLSRQYLKNSIGQKLTEDMIESAVKQYSTKRDEAGDSGKQVHKWIEDFIQSKISNGEVPEIPKDNQEVINGVMGFLKWYNDNEVEFLESEKIVYSKIHNYIGTFDVLLKVNGILTLADFKTGKAIYPEFWMQLSAYHQALLEETPELEIQQYSILHFNKEDGTFETVSKSPENINVEHFNNLLKLKNFLATLK